MEKKTKKTKSTKSTKATKSMKATKTTKKELTAKDRKKVTGGEGVKWASRKGDVLGAFCPSMIAGHSLEGKKFASAKEAEQYLLDMGCNRSEANKLAHMFVTLLAKSN